MVQPQAVASSLERITGPYRYKDLCFGENRPIVEALKKQSNKYFVLIRIEPIKGNERDVCQVFQDLLPWICRENGLKPEISRLVDLHLFTDWKWPIRILLAARTRTGIEADLAKFREIMRTCLNKDQIEDFRASWDANHQEHYNAVAQKLNEARKAGLRIEPSRVQVYTREELERTLAFFISPHASHHGYSED